MLLRPADFSALPDRDIQRFAMKIVATVDELLQNAEDSVHLAFPDVSEAEGDQVMSIVKKQRPGAAISRSNAGGSLHIEVIRTY